MNRQDKMDVITARMENLYAEGWTCLVGPKGAEVAISPSAEAVMEAMAHFPIHPELPCFYSVKWIPPSLSDAMRQSTAVPSVKL